jgi:hypothetical protein
VFQPLYIYGPHTAKDCEQWFVDRIIRWGSCTEVHLQCYDYVSTCCCLFGAAKVHVWTASSGGQGAYGLSSCGRVAEDASALAAIVV